MIDTVLATTEGGCKTGEGESGMPEIERQVLGGRRRNLDGVCFHISADTAH